MTADAEQHGWPVTGDPVVDDALAMLEDVDKDPRPEAHLRVLVAVHDALQHRLASAVE